MNDKEWQEVEARFDKEFTILSFILFLTIYFSLCLLYSDWVDKKRIRNNCQIDLDCITHKSYTKNPGTSKLYLEH